MSGSGGRQQFNASRNLPTRTSMLARRPSSIARDCEARRGIPSDRQEDAIRLHTDLETITMRAIEHAEAWDAVQGNRPGQHSADCVATSGVHDLAVPVWMVGTFYENPKCDFWKIAHPWYRGSPRRRRSAPLRTVALVDPALKNRFHRFGRGCPDECRSRSASCC